MSRAALVLVCVVASLAGCESAPPMPADLRVVAPADSVSPQARALAGTWTGKWNGDFDHVLVIEEISDTSAMLVYSIGASVKEGIQPQYRRVRAAVAGSTLKFRLGSNDVDYALQGDGTLVGTFVASGGRVSRAYMKRAPAKQ